MTFTRFYVKELGSLFLSVPIICSKFLFRIYLHLFTVLTHPTWNMISMFLRTGSWSEHFPTGTSGHLRVGRRLKTLEGYQQIYSAFTPRTFCSGKITTIQKLTLLISLFKKILFKKWQLWTNRFRTALSKVSSLICSLLSLYNRSSLLTDSECANLATLYNVSVTIKARFMGLLPSFADHWKIWAAWCTHSQLRVNKVMLCLISALIL